MCILKSGSIYSINIFPLKTSAGERSRDPLMHANAISDKRERSGEIVTTEEFELPIFDFSVIAMATDNFSHANKLGQGGFGSVYKVYISYLWTVIAYIYIYLHYM